MILTFLEEQVEADGWNFNFAIVEKPDRCSSNK